MNSLTNNIPIIYYHSIAPYKNKNWQKSWLTLELKYFEEHLKFFKNHNFQSLFLNEYFELKSEREKKRNYFVLTFDDGYVDNYIYVYPLLKKYGFKGTIFVSPEFTNNKRIKRRTLFDYWNNKASLKEIEDWGFLTWEEMREMEKSGIIDIQSHTMTHTKYFVSDKIVGFHNPGADCLYQIGNLYPNRKPDYIADPDFEKLIPYGYPFFKQASSIIAHRVTINQSFIQSIIQSLQNSDWSKPYNYSFIFNKIKPIYEKYKLNNTIIEYVENKNEYQNRVNNELLLSKDIIEKELNKKVEYLCWPHGDNNEFAHNTALRLGYKATTLGKMPIHFLDETRFDRFGLSKFKNSIFLTKLKIKYKVGSYRKEQPYYTIKNIYEFFRDTF